MVKTVLSFFTNTILLTLLLGLLIVPTFGGEFLVVESPTPLQNLAQRGEVAGVAILSNKDFSVYPNFTDFRQFAKFDPQGIENGAFFDNLTLTCFGGQEATYNQLYSVTNTSSLPLYFRLELWGTISETPFSELKLVFLPSSYLDRTLPQKGVVSIQEGMIGSGQTRWIMVNPGESAYVTAVVKGKDTTSTFTLPLIIKASL